MQSEERMVLVEGLDLAGKTTLCEGLVSKLQEQGWTAVLTKNNLLGENVVGKRAKRYAVGAHTTTLETGALFLASHFYDTTLFQPLDDGVVPPSAKQGARSASFGDFAFA